MSIVVCTNRNLNRKSGPVAQLDRAPPSKLGVGGWCPGSPLSRCHSRRSDDHELSPLQYYAHSVSEAPVEEVGRRSGATPHRWQHCSDTADNSMLVLWAKQQTARSRQYSDEFQRKLRGANIRVDHSTAGARVAMEAFAGFKPLGHLLAYVIAGHHAGLANGGSLQGGSTARSIQSPRLSPWDGQS